MSKLNSREDWEQFYNERKPDRDTLISALKIARSFEEVNWNGSPLTYTGRRVYEDNLTYFWLFCLGNANELAGKHPRIRAGRKTPHERRFFVQGNPHDETSFFVVYHDWDNREKVQVGEEKRVVVNRVLFEKTLRYFRRDAIQFGRGKGTVPDGKFNIYDKSGDGSKIDCIAVRNILPMVSLGIFELAGKDWLEYTNRTKITVGDSLEHYISFSGPGTSRKSSSIPAETTDEETTAEVLEICNLLELRSNVILEGVPGTGKTWIRDKVKIAMNAEMEVVTFHPASTYEEFVGGIFPNSSNDGEGTLLFEYQEGTLSRFADRAMGDQERDYILFIDEINRANIPLVMGELLTIIEPTKRTTPVVGTKALNDGQRDLEGEPWEVAVHVETDDTKSKYLRLPSNLYFLATMNTSDRSVVSMDAALRRRFAYYRIETKLTIESQEEMWAALKDNWLGDKKDTFDTVFSVLAEINQYLRTSIGPDAMLGHSYLFFNDDEVAGLDENQVVSEMMELNILPQIADTLTSMNKTDQHSVDRINKLLSKIPTPMFRHELKAPTSGGKSLDIAVTVVRITESEEYSDPKVLFDKDDTVFRHKVTIRDEKLKPPEFPEYAYIRHIGPNKEVEILAGSAIVPPVESFSTQYLNDKNLREEWVRNEALLLIQNDFGIFKKKEQVNSPSMAGRCVNGMKSFRGTLFKNKLGNNIAVNDDE